MREQAGLFFDPFLLIGCKWPVALDLSAKGFLRRFLLTFIFLE